jgi:hypothetical protein
VKHALCDLSSALNFDVAYRFLENLYTPCYYGHDSRWQIVRLRGERALPNLNPLTPNGHYSGRTASLTSIRCILNIYSTSILTEYFKHTE